MVESGRHHLWQRVGLDTTERHPTYNGQLVAGTFAYTPALGTILHGGSSQTLSAVLTPSDSATFTDATAVATIDVNPATPAITWANPADITYGTPLGAAQLNATSTTPGTFTYTPPAGTVLDVGATQVGGSVPT